MSIFTSRLHCASKNALDPSFNIKVLILVFGTLLSVLCSSVVAADISFAQITNSTNTIQQQQQPPSLSPSERMHAVKIVSPTRGQQIPAGGINNNNLTISGISIANNTNSSSHCQVDVIVNDAWPYQKATGTGPGGQTDYSKWNFTLSPKYTTIKEGLNKITSRYTCTDNPSIIAYYSVNVIGAPLRSTTAAVSSRQQG